MYLEKINSPADVKKLTVDEMTVLAGEMRKALLFRLSKHGGHFVLTSAWWKPLSQCTLFLSPPRTR